MEKYNEMKVYRANRRFQVGFPTIYTCRGMACNEVKSSFSVVEERLLYTGDCPVADDILCRVREYDGDKATSWYKTREEAWEAAGLLKFKDPVPEMAYLNTEQIEPLDKEFEVKFELDETGRPFTRLNAHPEVDGRGRKGKIFFPDRSFVGADLGRAKVSISKEFDTYGFLTGKMEPYEMVDMKEFLDWAWEKEEPDTPVYFINHPGRGRYIAIWSSPYPKASKSIMRITKAKYDWTGDRIWKGMAYDKTVERDVDWYTERKCTLTQLYLEDAWDMEVDLDAVLKKFGDASFIWSLQGITWVPSIKFWSETIDTACKKGFLTQYNVPGPQIEAIQVNPEYLDMLSHFSYNEVCEMAKKVNEINELARQRLTSLIRKF